MISCKEAFGIYKKYYHDGEEILKALKKVNNDITYCAKRGYDRMRYVISKYEFIPSYFFYKKKENCFFFHEDFKKFIPEIERTLKWNGFRTSFEEKRLAFVFDIYWNKCHKEAGDVDY